MKVYEIALNEDVKCIVNCASCSIAGICKRTRDFLDKNK